MKNQHSNPTGNPTCLIALMLYNPAVICLLSLCLQTSITHPYNVRSNLFSAKFGCLYNAACSGQTVRDLDAAWSKLSAAEIQERVGGGGGGRSGDERGKTLFDTSNECFPLHWAAYSGNSCALNYFIVSLKVDKLIPCLLYTSPSPRDS